MVSTEFLIKEILSKNCYSIEQKAKSICNFMTWNKQELITQIEKNEDNDSGHGEIILHFWNKHKN